MHKFSILILLLDSNSYRILIILLFFFFFYVFLYDFLTSEILLINERHVSCGLCNSFDREGEAWPLIQLRSDRNSTTEGLNDLLADTQAQADATRVDALGRAQLSEEPEQLFLVCLWDPDARVLHGHFEEISLAIESDLDWNASFHGEFYCVLQ